MQAVDPQHGARGMPEFLEPTCRRQVAEFVAGHHPGLAAELTRAEAGDFRSAIDRNGDPAQFSSD
jgi:hypothetical protein